MNRLNRAIKKYGLYETISKIPNFLRSRIKRLRLHPTTLTRFGISHSRWYKFQIEHELNFWNNIEGTVFYNNSQEDLLTKSFEINRNKFADVRLNFGDGIVADIGCGPQGGMLSFVKAGHKFGIDPLADEYNKKFTRDPSIIMLSSMGEHIPLLSNTVDACFCINALDHVMRPQAVLKEICRILKPGGYFAFSVDIGGTKKHPVKIYEDDLDKFFKKNPFKIVERKCSTENSVWGKEAGIPLYVFQGYKI